MKLRNVHPLAILIIGLVGAVLPAGAAAADKPVPPAAILSDDAAAIPQFVLKLYEGSKSADAQPTSIATSSYVQPTFFANLKDEAALEEERKLLRSTFNLADVRLFAQAEFGLRGAGAKFVHQTSRGQRDTFAVTLACVEGKTHDLEVVESNGTRVVLLKTRFVIPGSFTAKDAVVFGFEDSRKAPVFLSLRPANGGVAGGVSGGVVGGVREGVEGGVVGGVAGGVAGGVKGGIVGGGVIGLDQAQGPADQAKLAERMKKKAEFEKGAVRPAKTELPKLLRKVDPVYPPVAQQARVEGVVILDVRIDESGKVVDAMILRSIPLLDQAAIDAVKQWAYEPYQVAGKAVPAVFVVSVPFHLPGSGAMQGAGSWSDRATFEAGAVRAIGDIKPPRLMHSVDPVYPEIARQARVEGMVILEVRADEKGNIVGAKVLRSIPLLDQAAIDAVKQWKYEPAIVNGKPTPILFTVTVRFQADTAPGTKPVGAELVNPQLKTYVEPVYPPAAAEKKISGTVVLEIRVDAQGNVSDVKVLKSVPELDQAAIDAVRKWKYEPAVIDGKAVPVVATVRVSFGPKG